MLLHHIRRVGNAVYNVLIHETQRTDDLALGHCNALCGVAAQIPDIQRVTVINILIGGPYDDLVIVRNLQTFVLRDRYQPGACPIHQVNAVYHAVQSQIQLLLPVQIQQFLHLCRKNRIWPVIGNVEQLFHRILLAVVSAQLDAHLSLMPASVHVSVDGEFYVAALIYIQDFDGMLVVHGARIRVFLIIEAKDCRQLIGGHIVAVELVRHLEYYYIPIFALCHVHIRPCDAKQDPVVPAELLSVRDLGHGALIGQQIDSVRGIADAVIFPHSVIGAPAVFRGSHHKIHQH